MCLRSGSGWANVLRDIGCDIARLEGGFSFAIQEDGVLRNPFVVLLGLSDSLVVSGLQDQSSYCGVNDGSRRPDLRVCYHGPRLEGSLLRSNKRSE